MPAVPPTSGALRVMPVNVEPDGPDVPPRRDGVEQIARQDLLLRRALHVDDRRCAGHGDALFERADAHLRVDRCREVRRELDPFAPDLLKPGSVKSPCRRRAADR